MDTIYKASFAAKVISSFYDNKFKKHFYTEIKEITYRLGNISVSACKQEIYNIFKIFQIIFSVKLDAEYSVYKKEVEIFDYINQKCLLNKVTKESSYERILEYIENSINEENIFNSFFYFCLIAIELNKLFEYPCVPPVDLFHQISVLKNKSFKCNFLKIWLDCLYKQRDKDLKNVLLKEFRKNKETFNDLGFKHIYLFGSLIQGNYHQDSDIDLIVEFNDNLNIKEIKIAEKRIKMFNFDLFERKTDIINYDFALQLHDIKSTELIF